MHRLLACIVLFAALAWPHAGDARFLSADPVPPDAQTGANVHRYAYANDAPYRYVDPDGRWAEDAVLGIPSLVLGAKSFYDNVRVGNVPGAIVDGIGIAYDIGAIAAPGLPGGAGIGIRAGRAAAAGAEAARMAPAPDRLIHRMGESFESPTRLTRKAGESEEFIGVHGLSASTTRPDVPCVSATCGAIEAAGFKVHATPSRSDPDHVTIEMPKPVTKEVAERFNQTMGRSK